MNDSPHRLALGELLRQQREAAAISVRRLARMAGISGPYLSQIERGLRSPSDAVLEALATNLNISAEALRSRTSEGQRAAARDAHGSDTLAAISADPLLTPAQRSALAEVYTTFLQSNQPADARSVAPEGPVQPGATSGGESLS